MKYPNLQHNQALTCAYATNRKSGEGMTTYSPEPRPAREIPDREQLAAASRRQAFLEARGIQQPSKHHIGSSSGFHPEEDQYELVEDEEYYRTRLPTSARRYQNYHVSPRNRSTTRETNDCTSDMLMYRSAAAGKLCYRQSGEEHQKSMRLSFNEYDFTYLYHQYVY